MNRQVRPRVAVIGSGISGLTAAYRLQKDVDITVYEKDDWVGGHTHTVDVNLGGQTYAIDTGFIVFQRMDLPPFLESIGRTWSDAPRYGYEF